MYAGASSKLASVVLVAAKLQRDENLPRLIPPVFWAGAKLRAIAVGVAGESNAALGRKHMNVEICLG